MRPAWWAVARTRLPSEAGVAWRSYGASAGNADALAELARPNVSSSGAELQDVVADMHRTPIAALESRDGVPWALWVFAWTDAVLEEERPHADLQDSGTDGASPASPAYPFFLQAVAGALAQRLAQRDNYVAVPGGVVRSPPSPETWEAPSATEYHQLRVHTTHDELVVQVNSTYEPWSRLDMRARPGECAFRHMELGRTMVCLLPTLQRATLLYTLAAPDDTACRAVAARLATPLEQAGGTADHWAAVRVSMARPPPGVLVEPVALGVPSNAASDTGVPCQLLWPAALCLVIEAPTPPQPLALQQQSALSLLDAATWSPKQVPATAETMGPIVGIGAPPPPLSPVEDDVFQGIGQLTDDDLSFFGAQVPSEQPPAPAPAPAPPAPALHLPSESPRASLALKYDVHGKFFVGDACRRISESEMRSGVSPRTLYLGTPQSAMLSSPSQASGWDEQDDVSDEVPCLPAAQSALACARFHTPLAAPLLPPEPPRTVTALTERVHLEWTCAYAGAARYPVSPPPEPVPPPAQLVTCGDAQALPEPSVLVGCQAALIQVAPAAIARWRCLGLQPCSGPRPVVAHVALIDVHVPDTVVQQWLELGADTYAAHALGTCTPGQQWRYRGGQWLGGMPHVPASAPGTRERHVVYLLYDEPSVCERLYRTWPMPRSRIALVAVPLAQMLPMRWPLALAYAAYEEAHARVWQLAPRTYHTCTQLRTRLHWDAHWPRAEAALPLDDGAVLHVAYDRVAGVTRLVATDERAWLRHTSAWEATEVYADVVQLWHVVRGLLAASTARWRVVIGRYGCMPCDEVEAWATWVAQGGWERDAMDVVVVALDPAGLPVMSDGATPAWMASATGLAMHAPSPVVASHTVYVSAGAYAVHWVHGTLEAAVALHDVVVHWHALQILAQLGWPAPAPRLPWHMALLAHA